MIKYKNMLVAFIAIISMLFAIYACSYKSSQKQALPQASKRTHDTFEQQSSVNSMIPRTSKEIPGAFGYRFGDSLDKSMIIAKIVSENPDIYEEHLVKPIIVNKEFDKYSLTTCKKSKEICCIRGLKNFERRDQAMEYLENVRPILKAKYKENPSVTHSSLDHYSESLRNASTIISLILLSDKSGWAFMIEYSNELLKHQCLSQNVSVDSVFIMNHQNGSDYVKGSIATR